MNRTLRSSHLSSRSQNRSECSGTGPSVQNFTPVPVDRGGSASQNQDRCGATPPLATAVADAPSAMLGIGLGGPKVPLTAARNILQRIKWTKVLNTELMRAYYRSINIDTSKEGARLFQDWKKKYPEDLLNEQRLCSQLNSIRNRIVFSDAELENIKTEVRHELEALQPQQPNLHPNNLNDQEQSIGVNEDTVYNNRLPSHDLGQDEHVVSNTQLESLRQVYETYKLEYQGIPFDNRPRIPKLRCNAEIFKLTAAADELIKNDIRVTSSLEVVTNLVHCAALAVTAISMKLRKSDKAYEKKLSEKEEWLKHRIAALGARIRRYNEAAKRRQQERLFATDQKLFYRKLERETEDEQPQQFPSTASLKDYWAGIWTDPKLHDQSAPWLRD
ncbi:hypothetical protein B566_EDAN002466 [Ephemera danica]|nr:hypothetical protein B566_EDAN002466 [Ephemera danica]